MKKLFLLSLSLVMEFMQAMEKPNPITVTYDSSIDKLEPYLEELRNARTTNEETQAQLFTTFQKLFPLETVLKNMTVFKNPQVVVWFTNYFGGTAPSTATWYSTNLFNKVPQATFWLTDLHAWCFLAVDKKQLSQNYQKLIEKLDRNEQLTLQECPLITKRSKVLEKTIYAQKRYRSLFSQDFFKALANENEFSLFELVLDKANLLCKTQRREGRTPCSLQDLGYTSLLLNIASTKLAGQTFLTADFSLIFRLLQYLEGIYYAFKIIKDTISNDPLANECSIVFFIPNKEFTYYLVPQETALFDMFKQDLETVISACLTLPREFRILVYFQPFAYYTPEDNTLFAAPYRAIGNPCTKSKLEKLLP